LLFWLLSLLLKHCGPLLSNGLCFKDSGFCWTCLGFNLIYVSQRETYPETYPKHIRNILGIFRVEREGLEKLAAESNKDA
jgi:hypothetical protein